MPEGSINRANLQGYCAFDIKAIVSKLAAFHVGRAREMVFTYHLDQNKTNNSFFTGIFANISL